MAEVEQIGGFRFGICWLAGVVAILCIICFFFAFGGAWW